MGNLNEFLPPIDDLVRSGYQLGLELGLEQLFGLVILSLKHGQLVRTVRREHFTLAEEVGEGFRRRQDLF